jgi:isocitrate/isopropylmalate dehydrogenase
VQNALEFVYRKKKDKLTRDIGGPASTDEFADAVIEALSDPQSQAPYTEPAEKIAATS